MAQRPDGPADKAKEAIKPAPEKKAATTGPAKAPATKPVPKPAAKPAPRPTANPDVKPDSIKGEAPAPDADDGVNPDAIQAEVPKAGPRPKRSLTPGVWGIDLGQSALKAIRLQLVEGVLTATAFDYVEHPKILSQPDADPDQLTREALEKFLSRNNLRGDVVCVSVPGQSGLARFVKLPPVEEKKINDIVRFEAKQQIPFNLDEVIWDYQKIGSGLVADGFAMDTEIGLFAMKKDVIHRCLQHFRDVNVDVHVVQMAPLSLCNFVAYDLLGKSAGGTEGEGGEDGGGEPGGKKKAVVALDIGADSSNLVITDGEKIIWQRPIPLGGNHFTRALTKDLKLTFAKAEHLKRNATKSANLKEILGALKPVLNDFVGEVQRSLGYFTNTHRDAQVEYMVGLGNAFRLPGLQRYLSEKLQLEIKKLGKMERLAGDTVVNAPTYVENILSYGVAYGLALQGLKLSRLATNLLPAEIRTERLIKAKKPYAVACAAALLLGLSTWSLANYYMDREYKQTEGSELKKQMASAGSVEGQVSSGASAFTSAQAAARAEEAAVKSIIAGQDERNNWLEMLRFVNDAVPRPDASNFYSPHAAKYWKNGGHRAYNELLVRNGQLREAPIIDQPLPQPGIDPERPEAAPRTGRVDDLGKGIDELIQFNIEGVDFRYTDNLANFWTHVKTANRTDKSVTVTGKGDVRPEAVWDTPPEGAGWVVEIRGYTFHKDQYRFVTEGLLENLAVMGIRKPPAKPGDSTPPAGGTGATGATPPPAEKPPEMGPVINRLSHFVLYKYTNQGTPDRSGFTLINQSHLDQALMAGEAPLGGLDNRGGLGGTGGTGGAGGTGGTGDASGDTTTGRPSATQISRASWAPLGGQAAAAGPDGGTGMGRPRLPGGIPPGLRLPGSGPKGRDAEQPFPGGPPIPTPGTPPAAPGKHVRTEFVIFFVWKEHTPSDDLRGLSGGTGTSATTGPSSTPDAVRPAGGVTAPPVPSVGGTGGAKPVTPAGPPTSTPPTGSRN